MVRVLAIGNFTVVVSWQYDIIWPRAGLVLVDDLGVERDTRNARVERDYGTGSFLRKRRASRESKICTTYTTR